MHKTIKKNQSNTNAKNGECDFTQTCAGAVRTRKLYIETGRF